MKMKISLYQEVEDYLYLGRHTETLELYAVYQDDKPVYDEDILPGQKYRHYKGKDYQILCLAKDNTCEYVVYQALYNDPEYGSNAIWIRPLEMFKENVETGPRFKLLN